MRLTLLAIGRVRTGSERGIVAEYLSRAEKTGRGIGFSRATLVEVEPKGARGAAAEADALRRALPDGAKTICFDERGTSLSSRDFAACLAGWRDAGQRDAACVIGGADGLDKTFVGQADLVVSMGRMVWPHMLARIMVAEQLYRAASILAGTPYHRD